MADGLNIPPCRPYIIRALYDWMVDNRLTPQISVNVNLPGVELPLQYSQNGIIVLNISPTAVRNLAIDNDAIAFSARFGGVPHEVYVPMYAVTTIYPREDISLGMCMFPERAYDEMFESGNVPERNGGAHLAEVDSVGTTDTGTKKGGLEIVDSDDGDASKDTKKNQEKTETPIKHKKPTLEIVE